MKKIYVLVIAFLVVAVNCLAQVLTDSVISKPSAYNNSQVRPIYGMAIDTADNKWVAFFKIGLGKFDSTGWTMYDTTNSGIGSDTILSVACNRAGVWAGTRVGLYNFDGANWRVFNIHNSNIPNDTVLNLYSPIVGNELWIISYPGFIYFDGTSFHQYNTGNSGLVNDSVQCIFKSSIGIWWIGTAHGLSSFDGTSWQSYTKNNTGICDDNITSLIEDRNNYLFAGTIGGELFVKRGGGFTSLPTPYIFTPLVNLFRLRDGRIVFCQLTNTSYGYSGVQYIISFNPDTILGNGATYNSYEQQINQYTAFHVIDRSDRVWTVFRVNTSAQFMLMEDSLTYGAAGLISSPAPQVNATFGFLDINEVSTEMLDNNIFFRPFNNIYIVPKSRCGKNALYTSSLWIGGLDSSGGLHTAGQMYRQSGDDFWSGPLDTLAATLDSATKVHYDSIWRVDRRTIDLFITEYNLGNVSNHTYAVPNAILTWPAHGSGNYSRYLAPFIDHNADGLYNPYDGDYPDLKGDQMLWWVMNDHFRNSHGETRGIPFGIEIRSKAYAYSCQNVSVNDEAINYSTFYSDSIINRSDTDYYNVHVGIFTDVDLGNYSDDYVGCRVDGDYAFGYNGDNNDEGSLGYGLNPPMINVAILKGPIADVNDGLDNNHNGVVDEPGETCMMNHFQYFNNDFTSIGNPTTASHYYYYLKSLWKDSSHVTYGGSGYRGQGTGGTMNPADYMYSGMPYDTGWTEASAGFHPGDRRFVMSSGPFTLKAHQSKTLDYAIVFTRDESAPNGLTTSVAKNDHDVRMVKHWFETDSFPCANSYIGIKEPPGKSGFALYPNPATKSFNISVSSKEPLLKMELLDVTGRLVWNQQIVSNRPNFISTREIASGIYFVKVTGRDVLMTRKLVVE